MRKGKVYVDNERRKELNKENDRDSISEEKGGGREVTRGTRMRQINQ